MRELRQTKTTMIFSSNRHFFALSPLLIGVIKTTAANTWYSSDAITI